MLYEDVKLSKEVRILKGSRRGEIDEIIDYWPPSEPTVILKGGGEYAISEVEIVEAP